MLLGMSILSVSLVEETDAQRRILLRLRQAAGPNTRLLLADFVLPLACVDEDEDVDPDLTEEGEDSDKKITRLPLPGTVRTLAPEGSSLLPNLGKANANAYWLDLTVCCYMYHVCAPADKKGP